MFEKHDKTKANKPTKKSICNSINSTSSSSTSSSPNRTITNKSRDCSPKPNMSIVENQEIPMSDLKSPKL